MNCQRYLVTRLARLRQGICHPSPETPMSPSDPTVPDVFSAREIARAAGVHPGRVRGLIAGGQVAVVNGRYLTCVEAVRAVRLLRHGTDRSALFAPPPPVERSPAGALAASGALHAVLLAALVLLTTLGSATPSADTSNPVRLVFLALPGPGGGGGGGGLRQPAPAARAELKGRDPVPSPVAIRTVRRPDPAPRPAPVAPRPVAVAHPDPPRAAPPPEVPPVEAPVASAPADAADTVGIVSDQSAADGSHGRGDGGGAGSGAGAGLGEGTGAGIGPGSGGGTGGGPYRPGTGITPPAVQREVKPDYTEEARRRGLAGDVVLEIVVRSDGSVGDVRLLQGLGGGLDQRAVDAVRQWRFSPARRYGVPVDVLVEIAVEFKLR